MKKFLILFIALIGILATNTTVAQLRVDTKKTVSAADTSKLSLVGDNVVSISYAYVETSGTSAGKIYIQGSNDNVYWKHIDSSLSITDVTTVQGVHIAVTATTFLNYRAIFSNTSSATGTIYFTLLRRPGELRLTN